MQQSAAGEKGTPKHFLTTAPGVGGTEGIKRSEGLLDAGTKMRPPAS